MSKLLEQVEFNTRNPRNGGVTFLSLKQKKKSANKLRAEQKQVRVLYEAEANKQRVSQQTVGPPSPSPSGSLGLLQLNSTHIHTDSHGTAPVTATQKIR